MDISEDNTPVHTANDPDWEEMFNKHFAGASVGVNDNEAMKSLLGYEPIVINHIWKNYGQHVKIGKRMLAPKEFCWFLSYMRTGLTWIHLSLMWRAKETTFRRVVKDTVRALSVLMDVVRTRI